MIDTFRLGVIGAGNIARYHLEVLGALEACEIIGISSRRGLTASALASEFNIPFVYDTSLDLVTKGKPDALMVLVSPDQTYEVCCDLLPHKLPIFVEKPAALSLPDTERLADICAKHSVSTMVGFNRRFYSIFRKGLDEISAGEGQLHGILIEGHERLWKLGHLYNRLRGNWLFANSIHNIDLIRFFGGEIDDLTCFSNSFTEPGGDQFIASSITRSGILVSYVSHWHSPGGWSVRLFGHQKAVEFMPLEKGVMIDIENKRSPISPDNEDIMYRPGFYRQSLTFSNLVRTGSLNSPGQSIEDSIGTARIIAKLANSLNRKHANI